MISSDKKLILLGAGPAVVCGLLMLTFMLAALVGGGQIDWSVVRTLAMVSLMSAIFFPALGNVLRMRRDRRHKVR